MACSSSSIPRPGPFGHFQKSIANPERLLDIAFAERDLFLAKEVRNAAGDLDAGRQRDGAERVVRRDIGVVGFRHARDETDFGDAAGVAHIRLQNGRGLFLEHFAGNPIW